MDFKTLVGIATPILQAPMAGVQGSALAIAVSNAGALGALPGAMLSAAALSSELTTIREQTSKPYNVNFFCHAQPSPDAAAEVKWRATFAPYAEELGVTLDGAVGVGRTPFNLEALDVLRAFKPAVVSFHFGLPASELLEPLRAMGAKILASATTVEEALWLEARGVDAVIAQGLEAGGHRGSFLAADLTEQLGTFALVPQIVGAVKLPVIAAGGIADCDGVAAALRLGASAVQVGTAFLLCPEAPTSAVHRAALTHAEARHTAITNVFSGRPARGIVNRAIRELGPLNAKAPAFPIAAAAMTPLRMQAGSRGSGDFSPLWLGQNVSGCKSVPAAQLVHELAAET